jgi:hypothetical protein
MKQVVLTQHEINQATRPAVYRNKKKYNRKSKENVKSNLQASYD